MSGESQSESERAGAPIPTGPIAQAGLVFDDRYLWHDTGETLIADRSRFPFAEPIPHWSSPALVGRAKHLIDFYGVSDHMLRIPPHEATDDALLVYHTRDYLDRIRELDGIGGDAGEGTPMGIGSERIARLAAGGVMAAVDAVMDGAVRHAYALVRPPGHHAMAGKGMGFCVFNNVVVAARHAQREHGVDKIVIVDWDVHHGNGTQAAFYDDPSVLFISLHQDDLYPAGWGAIEHTGAGIGAGSTVNVPLPAGSGWAAYKLAFERVVLPIAREFAPDFVFVSAGQDANVLDPLARMCLTTENYREMTRMMLGVASDACGGRLVVAQEGGYAPSYAPYCSASVAEVLAGVPGNPVIDPYGERAATQPAAVTVGRDAQAAIDAVCEAQRAFWNV